MPSTYAHFRMGQDVLKEVNTQAKSIIETYPELYLIGLHGPDLLFYYKPFYRNFVNKTGFGMHDRSGVEVFQEAAERILRSEDSEALKAYVYGFICHFALDTTCHGYIEQKIKSSGIAHTEIEVEFDRELMVMDGFDPIRHNLTNHLVPSAENAAIIALFFDQLTKEEVEKAIKSMIRYINILTTPSKIKRNLINLLLCVTGNYKEIHGLIVNYQKNPRCNDSTKKLLSLYQEARKLSICLINSYDSYLSGEQPLHSIYRYNFGSVLVEEEGQQYEVQVD